MKTKFVWFYFFICLHAGQIFGQGLVVTGAHSGRLGDQLIGFSHALWVTYLYPHLQLVYREFPYHDQLELSNLHRSIARSIQTSGPTLKVHQTIQSLINQLGQKQGPINIPYFPESSMDFQPVECPILEYKKIIKNPHPYFAVNWDDPQFKTMLKARISPKQPLNLIQIPEKCFSIALHIRKTSNGFDSPLLHGSNPVTINKKGDYADVHFPLKFPPEKYYKEALQEVITRYPDEQFFIHIFTDEHDVAALYSRFEKAIGSNNICWSYRTEGNSHTTNVLEDLFSMSRFDCLIRADSNLSIIAEKIGDHKIVVSPKNYQWYGTFLKITEWEIRCKQ